MKPKIYIKVMQIYIKTYPSPFFWVLYGKDNKVFLYVDFRAFLYSKETNHKIILCLFVIKDLYFVKELLIIGLFYWIYII